MTPTTIAVVAAGIAAWLFASPGAAAVARLARLQPAPAPATGLLVPLRWPSPRRAAALTGSAAAVVGGLLVGPAAVIPGGVAVGEAVRRLLLGRRQRAAAAVRNEVAQWCTAMVSELRVGRAPTAALTVAGEVTGAALGPLLAPVAAVAALGGDVGSTLLAVAGQDGAQALRQVAACWTVASDAGAGLATALHRLGAGLHATERVRAEVTAQLAGARASARLLAFLPVFGLLLGQAVGAQPMRFLLHTTAGATCAALTVVLNVIGLAWTDRIAARVPMP